jgi:thiol-disulfide isomerase/thioredoxin
VKAAKGSALFVFFGSEDPATGASWCPDCVTADPVLRRACSELRPDLTLHECPVGERSAWKNQPAHPYRLDPDIRLARIPTLIRFDDGCERGRLVEGDCAQVGLVAAFLGR